MRSTACYLAIMLLLCCAQVTLALPRKKALVIGVGVYKPGNGWPTLHGDADVRMMKSTLMQIGFEETNIMTLQNEKADKKGIMDAMNTMLAQCLPGDIIVFHFSGHGQQLRDLDGDETDGFDEALVPYDAPSTDITRKYDGKLHLTDDELNLWFGKVRAKIGEAGQLIVFLDACHTGTASRGGNTVIRGGMPPLLLSSSTAVTGTKDSDLNQSGYDQQSVGKGTGKQGAFVLFSAAQSDKTDYEYQDKIGSLTYALARAFTNNKFTPNTSFRDLYEEVRNLLALLVPYQNPGLEGDKDVTAFGGDIVAQDTYFYVQKIRGKEITISGGTLMQVDKDATIGFYKAATRSKDTATPLVTGKVISATAFTALVVLDNSYSEDRISQCRAMVMEEGVKDRRTKVYISPSIAVSYPVKLVDILSSVRQIQLVDSIAEATLLITDSSLNGIVWLRIVSARENIDLINPVDMTQAAIIYDCNGNDQAVDALTYIIRTVKNYSVNSIIKTADVRSNSYRLKINLFPVGPDKNNTVKTVLQDENNVPVIRQGQSACLRISNTGSKGGFLMLVEFNPDGSFCAIRGTDENIRLEAGKRHDFTIGSFSPPYGRYIIKGFLTEHPIGNELSLVLNRQSGIRTMQDDITKLLGDMLDEPVGARDIPATAAGCSASFSYELLNQ